MVSQNPLFHGGLSIRKLSATVINDVWVEVLFFTLVATMVSLVSDMTSHQLAVNPVLLGVLGTVLGLVISFRTSSAYERYQDGRKLWTTIQVTTRNLAQLIWIHIPDNRSDMPKFKDRTVLQNVIEKKSMVNLVQAFPVSLKHFLRGENGVYYQDLYPLISFLPRYGTVSTRTDADLLPLWQASEDGEHPYDHDHSNSPTAAPTRSTTATEDPNAKGSWFSSRGRNKTIFDLEKTLPTVHSHRPLKPARNPPKGSFYDYVPFLLIFKPITDLFKTKKSTVRRDALGRKIKPQLGDSNVPLEITLFLSNYFNWVLRSGLVQPAVASSLVGGIATLGDCLSNLERIATTPLPFAYQAHLRMSLWLYLLLLPFQIWSALKYLTIPGTAFASFLFLGFLEIGQEIENPFNYDLNDLDIDSFCLAIQRELHEITAHPVPDPSEFMFSAWNQPFAPADRRTAEDLIKNHEYKHQDNEAGMGSVRKVLLKNWKDVDELTRHHH